VHRSRRTRTGFTIIELVVVMAVIGLLLTIAAPRYLDSLDRGKDRVAEYNAAQLRKAIDQYFSDRGTYPDRLEELVERRYLRSLPSNPYTGHADWVVVQPNGAPGKVYDVLVSREPVGAPEQTEAQDGEEK
jgi:general secretion pathway protein G